MFIWYLQANLPVVRDLESGTFIVNSGRRTATRSGELTTQKQRTTPQARGDLLLQLTENLETLIRRASEQRQHLPERWNMDKFTLPMNLLWMETALLLYAEQAQNQEILKVRDYKEFLPVTSKSDQ